MSDEGSEAAVDQGWGGEPLESTFPVDLLAVVLLAAGVVYLAVTSSEAASPVRIALGLGFTVFAPGYALVSLLLPASTLNSDGVETVSSGTDPFVVTTVERLLLSVGFSVILVSLVGIVLNYSQWGLHPVSMVASIGAATIVLAVLAAGRRRRVPRQRRYVIASFGSFVRLRNWVVAPGNRLETALNVGLILGLLLAVAGVGVALATVDNGERYTEFYLLSEDPETGELVADEYPTNLTRGEQVELHVGISNQEGERTTYTVVVLLERMAGPPGEKTVAERTELDSFERTLAHGNTWEGRHRVEPSMEGERLRLTYLLYEGSPPADPSVDNAHRNLHLWVDVADSDGEG